MTKRMTDKQRNLRKAAILVQSLGSPFADSLLGAMTADQREVLRQAVESLSQVGPEEQAEVIEEFFRIGPLVPDRDPTGIELDGQLPADLLVAANAEAAPAPARASAADDPRAPRFRFLHEAPPESLTPFLEREHPQTIAVVVSHLPPVRAAQLLAALGGDLQLEVARRLVDLNETDPEILREVERGLESWICHEVRGEGVRTAGMAALLNILDAADSQTKQHILANLGHENRQAVGKLEPCEPAAPPPLAFADLQRFDLQTLAAVLAHAPADLLLLALAGASSEFAHRAVGLFPAAEARALSRALANLGPTRLSDVEEAQQELAALAGRLEQRGVIGPLARGHLSVAV